MIYQEFASPVGRLFLASDGVSLTALAFEKNWPRLRKKLGVRTKETCPLLEKTKKQLTEYFAGSRRAFVLPISAPGTDFQKKAWSALSRIPYGETVSYRDQAVLLDRPGASRAVGRANALNPVSIVVPCHRVISTTGDLTGYAGGVRIKEFLLKHEGFREIPTRPQPSSRRRRN